MTEIQGFLLFKKYKAEIKQHHTLMMQYPGNYDFWFLKEYDMADLTRTSIQHLLQANYVRAGGGMVISAIEVKKIIKRERTDSAKQ